jgi:hypothetical protein
LRDFIDEFFSKFYPDRKYKPSKDDESWGDYDLYFKEMISKYYKDYDSKYRE